MKTIPDYTFEGIRSVLGVFSRTGVHVSTRHADAARRARNLLKKLDEIGRTADTGSQSRAILSYLESGRGLTSLDAIRLFRCTRLGARIYDLRKMGYAITGRRISKGGKRFVRYFMERRDE